MGYFIKPMYNLQKLKIILFLKYLLFYIFYKSRKIPIPLFLS